jgi:hypothetical protein
VVGKVVVWAAALMNIFKIDRGLDLFWYKADDNILGWRLAILGLAGGGKHARAYLLTVFFSKCVFIHVCGGLLNYLNLQCPTQSHVT